MTLVQIGIVASLFAVPVGVVVILTNIFSALRESREAKRKRRDQEIEDALRPVRAESESRIASLKEDIIRIKDAAAAAIASVKEDLVGMTTDRNYWRDRASNLEDRQYGREPRSRQQKRPEGETHE